MRWASTTILFLFVILSKEKQYSIAIRIARIDSCNSKKMAERHSNITTTLAHAVNSLHYLKKKEKLIQDKVINTCSRSINFWFI